MALTKPTIYTWGLVSDVDSATNVQGHDPSDIYRYDIDNRPLIRLQANDDAIKDTVDDIVDEIQDAYTGKNWPTGSNETWTSLDTRFDNMDTFLQQLFEIRNVQFSSFYQSAQFLSERYTSGFMNGPFPDSFIRQNAANRDSLILPSPYGSYYIPATKAAPKFNLHNRVSIETRISQIPEDASAEKRKPLRVMFRGFVIQLYNAFGGADDVADEEEGCVTIHFDDAPSTGHRFDFGFLEFWLKEINPTGDYYFYPYGSVDSHLVVEDESFAVAVVPPGGAYSGQVSGRKLKESHEVAVYARYGGVYEKVLTNIGAGSPGVLVACHATYTHWEGVVDYDNGDIEATVTSAPSYPEEVDLLVSYCHKAVTDPDDETLRGTISFTADGNYVQMQHRIRAHSDVDYANEPDLFTDVNVLAQGPATSPVATYNFTNSLNDFHDGVLWHAGTGSAGDISSLGTFDGYIHAIPLCLWSRFNQQTWATDEQNGGSGRPDGYVFNVVSPDFFLDLRPSIFSERYDLKTATANTLDRVLRGTHRSIMGQPAYDYNDTGVTGTDPVDAADLWAAAIPEIWRIDNSADPGGLNPNANHVRDVGNALTASAFAVTSKHDGFRRIFSPQEEVQEVPFTISYTGGTGSVSSGSPLVGYSNPTNSIQIAISAAISGYSADPDTGAFINDSVPRLWWRGTQIPVKLTSNFWTNLGTKSAYCSVDITDVNFDPNGHIDGYVDVLYPESTGIPKAPTRVSGFSIYDGASWTTSIIAGNKDGMPSTPALAADDSNWTNLPAGMDYYAAEDMVYVCDSANSRVVRLNANDLSFESQWPLQANYPVDLDAFSSTTDLRYPIDVCVDQSNGEVYVVDRDDNRVVKLNAELTTLLGEFGTSGTGVFSIGAGTSALIGPEGVAIDSSSPTPNLFICDTENYRIIKCLAPPGAVDPTYTAELGEEGVSSPGENQFIQPTGATVGDIKSSERLIVADQSRIVVINPSTFEVEDILGSSASGEMRDWFRNMQYGITDIVDDDAGTDGFKYVCWNERRTIVKFDSGWNPVGQFGLDGVTLPNKVTGLVDPVSMVFDPNYGTEGALYVADTDSLSTSTLLIDGGTRSLVRGGRVVMLDCSDMSYVDELSVPFKVEGITMYVDDSVAANDRVFICGGSSVESWQPGGYATRDDMTTWINIWEQDSVVTKAFDIAVSHDLTVLFVGDLALSEVVAVEPASGSLVATSTPFSFGITWPPDEDRIGAPVGLTLVPFTAGDTHHYINVVNSYDKEIVQLAVDITNHDFTHVDVTKSPFSDKTNWGEAFPYRCCFSTSTDIMYTIMDTGILVYDTSATYVPDAGTGSPVGDVDSLFLKDLFKIPFTDDLDLTVEFENVRAVAEADDIIYVTDIQANTVTAINALNFRVIGQIGSPASTGKGVCSFAGPGGITVKPGAADQLFIADTFSNRLISSSIYFPTVEAGTGRISFLIPPSSSYISQFIAVYPPYQGAWDQLSEPAIYGRNFITDNNTLYMTTLGRGTPTILQPDGGIGAYANMIERLPSPSDIPAKLPRVDDSYIFTPEPLPITSESGGTPYLQLPVINRYPASAQEIYPLYGGGAMSDYARILFTQGPGRSWPSGSSVEDWIPRGFEATGTFPGGDVLETFPLKTLSIPRVLFSTALVEIRGVVHLVIYTCYKAHAENKINDGPIVADIFRLYGNPGIKSRY